MKAIMNKEGLSQKEFYEKYGTTVTTYNRFGFITFVLRMLTSYYYAMQYVYVSYGSQDIAIALTEILYCFAKFLLIWGVLFMIRKYMNKWEFFIKRSTLKAVKNRARKEGL